MRSSYQSLSSYRSRLHGACRYSPEASETEEEPDQHLLQRPARDTRSARPDQGGSSGFGQDRGASGAGPRVVLRWSGRPESLSSQPPLQAMLRSHPRNGRQPERANEGAAGSRALKPRSQAAGPSPDHSLRRSQRSVRSTALPSPAPEDPSRHAAEANGSAAAFTQMPSQDPPSTFASARTNGFAFSPGRARRTRLRHPSPSATQALGQSAMQTEDNDALMDEQEQLEEAIRQSLLSSEEKQDAEGHEFSAAPSSAAQKGRSGLRIKLRGAS